MRKRLLWAVWLLSLAACPAGLLMVSLSYPDVATRPPPWPPDQPPQWLAEHLLRVQAWLSLAAAAAVFVLVRRWLSRVVVCAGVAAWLGVTALFALSIILAKTGKHL